MKLEFHPEAPRGTQWSITVDGRTHGGMSQHLVEALLQRSMSVRAAAQRIAEARLASTTSPIAG